MPPTNKVVRAGVGCYEAMSLLRDRRTMAFFVPFPRARPGPDGAEAEPPLSDANPTAWSIYTLSAMRIAWRASEKIAILREA